MSDQTTGENERPIYRRRVLIPVRPLDLVALADPNNPIFGRDDDEDGDGDGDGDEDGKGKNKKNKDKKDKDKDDGGSKDRTYTNGDCFVKVAPEGATNIQQTCVSLANSAPGMLFTPLDYQRMPPECRVLVDSKCR